MSALIKEKPRSVRVDCLPLSTLRKLVRDDEGAVQQEAKQELLKRIVDLDLQYREDDRDHGVGWSSVSPLTMIGESLGGNGKGSDKLERAYDRGIWDDKDQQWAHTVIEALPPRRRVALLISRRKRLPNRYDSPQDTLRDIWTQEYSYILVHLSKYCMKLKVKPEDIAKCRYKDVIALKDAAKNAKIEILLALSA